MVRYAGRGGRSQHAVQHTSNTISARAVTADTGQRTVADTPPKTFRLAIIQSGLFLRVNMDAFAGYRGITGNTPLPNFQSRSRWGLMYGAT